jgi:hypothetical protein
MTRLDSAEGLARVEDLQRKLDDLNPTSAKQQALQARAVQIADEIQAVRWLAILQAQGSTPIPLLIALVLWLSIIFGALVCLLLSTGQSSQPCFWALSRLPGRFF